MWKKIKNYLFFPTDLLKNIKFRVKENEFEDKIYAFGYKLNEHEIAEITNEIEEHIKVEKCGKGKFKWEI